MCTLFQKPSVHSKNAVSSLRPQCPCRQRTIQEKNKSGNEVYYRKYRKASKVWDVTPTVLKKDYKYIPALTKDILNYCDHST